MKKSNNPFILFIFFLKIINLNFFFDCNIFFAIKNCKNFGGDKLNDLIYEKSLRVKVGIVKCILENNGKIEKFTLQEKLLVSPATFDKYLSEMYSELPRGFLVNHGNYLEINNKAMSFYDVQIFYLSNSIIKDIMYTLFFEKNVTFEKLAQKLYISSSKLFNVMKFLKERVKPLDITIITSPYISIKGPIESILVFYNLLLHMLNKPYEESFSKYDKRLLRERVISFFKSLDIKISNRLVDEMSLWVISISDISYMKKLINEENLWEMFSDTFILPTSPVIQTLKNEFSKFFFGNTFSEEAHIIFVILLIFNTTGLHFNSCESEREFFTRKLNVDFKHKNLIFELIIKDYITPNDINILSTKVESCLHFFTMLSPYYYLNRDFFDFQAKNSIYFNKIYGEIAKDCSDLLSYDHKHSELNSIIYDLIVYVVVSCQNTIIEKEIITLGVYSSKGSLYENSFCSELNKAIRIVPCHMIDEQEEIDILIIDDLRLLGNHLNYKDYLLIDSLDHFLRKSVLSKISEKVSKIEDVQ